MDAIPKLSVVIPVYNEEAVLPQLFSRLYPSLDALGVGYEIVFINDGSKDRSAALLRAQFTERPENTRVILFHANFGQHSAVMAGLAYARGDYVVTLDADLQNPPEEIGKLVAKLDEGYDYVGTIRQQRQDSWWRRWFSRRINALRERITPVRITDQGCMMRGYARSVVDALNQTREVNTFIPALASLYSMRPVEVPISHEERFAGRSKYSMYSLIRLNFDLITGFSVVPLQLFSMTGMAVALLSALFFVLLMVRRFLVGSEAEGVFTLFAVVFFLVGVALFGIGLLGEYVGRIYAQVRERPRYIVEAVLERRAGHAPEAGMGHEILDTRPVTGAVTRAVVFAYSEVGVRCVRELLAGGVEIPLLFTHDDDPNEQQWFGSVRALAAAHGLEAHAPSEVDTAAWIAAGRAARPDFLFSFYYRHMLGAEWLAVPARGALNMHGSLLPRYRGRAPVHWAILNGEAVTGASLHYMVDKPDAGALVDQEAVAILENDDALAVSLKVAEAAATVLRRSLPKLENGSAAAVPLDLAAGSYFGRRRPEDGRIDWRRAARAIHDLVRAVAPPFPGAFSEVNGCRLAIDETRVDGAARHADRAPCLYQENGAWYADCVDGRRLHLVKLALDGERIGANAVPPRALAPQPVQLS